MNPNAVIPLLTTIVGVLFVILMVDQLFTRRRSYKWAWTFGMLVFTAAMFAQVWGIALGWNDAVYKLWYASGAIAAAAWWGAGSVYLLAQGRWWGHLFMALVAILTTIGAVVLIATPVIAGFAFPEPDVIITGKGIAQAARTTAAVSNILGTIAVVGVALWSAIVFALRPAEPGRALSMLLIVTGTLVVAAGGGLSRFDVTAPFYLTQLVGLAVVFAGFAVNAQVFSRIRIPLLGALWVRRETGERGELVHARMLPGGGPHEGVVDLPPKSLPRPADGDTS